jgi:hypothetical protein
VTHLRETLVSTEARAEHLAEALQRLFPGSFGKLLALLDEPFLPASLETEAQKARWLKLVAYLDTLEEPPADHPFLQLIGSDDQALLAQVRQQQREGVTKLLREDEEAMATLRANVRQMMRSLKEDEVLRARHRQAFAHSADLFGLIGDRNDRLNALLPELSEDYRRYLEVGATSRSLSASRPTSSASWATA